jgi:hypothetical protein
MHQEHNIQVLDPYYTLLVKATPRRLGNMLPAYHGLEFVYLFHLQLKHQQIMDAVTYSRDRTRSCSRHQEQNIQVLDPYYTQLAAEGPPLIGR